MMQLSIRCAYVQKFMNWLLLFTTGPLLLSVKGIIDLAQMPPTILLPHPGGTGTPSLERIAYLPGAQPPFPPRAFNPTSISPGENLPPPFPTPRVSLSTLPPSPCSLALLSAALRWPEVSKVSSEFSFCPFYCSRTGKSDSLNQHLHGSTLCSHIPTERPDGLLLYSYWHWTEWINGKTEQVLPLSELEPWNINDKIIDWYWLVFY